MGNCFSKSSVEEVLNVNVRSSKNRFDKSEKKLGEKEKENAIGGKKLSNGGNDSHTARKVGGNGDNSLSVKEAAAKAAESRYNLKQQQLETSREKLHAASKLSRQEKGL